MKSIHWLNFLPLLPFFFGDAFKVKVLWVQLSCDDGPEIREAESKKNPIERPHRRKTSTSIKLKRSNRISLGNLSWGVEWLSHDSNNLNTRKKMTPVAFLHGNLRVPPPMPTPPRNKALLRDY